MVSGRFLLACNCRPRASSRRDRASTSASTRNPGRKRPIEF
jgi:hypothetical protein